MDPSNNHPHILQFLDEDDDIVQFFVAVELSILYECPSLTDSVYLLLAIHYVFNMKYNDSVNDVFLFFQEKILELPIDKYGNKKSPTYENFMAALACHMS